MKKKLPLILVSIFILICILGNAIPGILRQIDAENRSSTINESLIILRSLREETFKNPPNYPPQEFFQKIQNHHQIKSDWTYITGLTTSSPPKTPILATPILSNGKFDPSPFNNKAIITTIDGETKTYPIRPDGTIHFTHPDGTTYNPFLPKNLPPEAKILTP